MFSFLHHCSWISCRVASSFLCSVSSESQSDHRPTSLVCFRCLTLCHQICFVLLCADACKICQLLLHNMLHIHVFQHHMFHSSKSSLGCPCFCRCRRIISYTSYSRTNDCTNNGYVNDNLEHNTMINIDTVAHMILHYTQS